MNKKCDVMLSYHHLYCWGCITNSLVTFHFLIFIFLSILFHHVPGADQVVLGDLVYCKGDDTEKVTGVVNSECEDDNCNDAYDSSNLDEIAGADLPEERNNSVKVWYSIIDLW